MKKDSIAKFQVTKSQIPRMAAKQRLTVGLDLGDRSSRYCILNEAGENASEDHLPTTKAAGATAYARRGPRA
jgi:transposase